MSPWLNGLRALSAYSFTTICILFLLVWGQVVFHWLIRKIISVRLSDAEKISLGMAGWILPLAVWAIFSYGMVLITGEVIGRIISFSLLIASLLFSFKQIERPSLSAIVLILFFAASLVLRFAFIYNAILPAYFDSAEHYRIITDLLGTTTTITLVRYYHIGYHLISASVVQIFQLDPVDVMLVFGQVILAALPLPFYFIIKQLTKSEIAAGFTCLLAGFGWHMPAHVLNWGKYPALLSLGGLLFILSVGISIYPGESAIQRRVLYFLVGLAALITAFIHTRAIIVFAIVFISIFRTNRRIYLPFKLQIISFLLIFMIFVFAIVLIWVSPVQKNLLDGYLQNDSWMLVLSAALFIVSAIFYNHLTFLLLVFLALILFGVFIPIPIPAYGMMTLLDRPYVQMLMFLPLSFLAGLGLAGLTQWIVRLFPRRRLPAQLILFSSLGLVLWNAALHYHFYPSPCCQLVSRDDMAAIAWIEHNLPPDAGILAASESLYVTALESSADRTGVDGGIWVAPLTSRHVTLAWQGLDLIQPDAYEILCKKNLSYIYVGGMPKSFNPAQLDSFPNAYQAVFSLPGAKIYQVTGCD